MPVLNFKKQFAPMVESGKKRQTIRAYRKDGGNPKKGDKLYLYTGLRTKGCRKLKEVVCKATLGVIIDEETMYLESFSLSKSAKKTVAILDGFKNYDEFQSFFEKIYGLPFYGLLITW